MIENALSREERRYTRLLRAYEEKAKALRVLRTKIQDTVRHDYLVYTYKCDRPYDMLCNLQAAVSPNDD
jgi:hypothetical protein